MTFSHHDVVVVGAGPAGSAAAIALADAGLDVVVVDKARFPRDKTCGDGLTTLALRELERIGLDPGTVASWAPVSGAVLHSPGGRTVALPLPGGRGLHAATARRMDLDSSLVDLAGARGVQVVSGTAVRSVSMTIGSATVETEAGQGFVGRWIVAADGVWSSVRKALRLDEHRYRGEWHGFRQYLRTTGSGAETLHVWFEEDLLPGYAWSFPLDDGWTNVGFGVLRGHRMDGKAMAARWRDLLTRPRVAAVLGTDPIAEGPHRAWPIPARVTDTCLAAGRVLFAGDAARATDLFTGEGIGQALLTGRLAAETIVATGSAHDAPARVTEAYRAAVLHELAPDHRMASLLSRVMSSRPLAEAAIATVGLNDWTRRNVGRWLFEDSPRGIALTPHRWRRGALSGPPAFAGPPPRTGPVDSIAR